MQQITGNEDVANDTIFGWGDGCLAGNDPAIRRVVVKLDQSNNIRTCQPDSIGPTAAICVDRDQVHIGLS